MSGTRSIIASFYKAGVNTLRHDGVEHAGYLAFLTLLGLFPFLVFVAALAGVFAQAETGARFFKMVLAELPPDMAAGLGPSVNEIVAGPPQGLLTVAILGAIWTASSAVDGYRTILNRAYGVTNPPGYLWRRLLAVLETLVLSFLVVLAMIVLVVLPLAWEKVERIFGRTGSGLTGKHLVVFSLLAMFCAIAAAYYLLPNIKQRLRAVLPGAALVTILWVAAARLLSIYLSRFSRVNLVYGSLGGVIATLLFLYVNNIIFIYGAEFNGLMRIESEDRKKPE